MAQIPANAHVKPKVRQEEAHLFTTHAAMVDRLEKSFFCNTPLMSVHDMPIMPVEFVAAALLARTNLLFPGAPGGGKSLLAEAIHTTLYGARGAWMRADMELSVRRYYCEVNPGGKTQAEIFVVRRDMLETLIAVVDEVTRAHGVILNPILGLCEGRLILDSELEPLDLGRGGYFVVLATANPATDVNSGTFGLDPALDDRFIGLNFDTVAPCRGDVALMEMRSAGREGLVPDEMLVTHILEGYRFLKSDMVGMTDEQKLNRQVRALIQEIVFRSFAFITASGNICEEPLVDKSAEDWRQRIPTGGHAAGSAITYCSRISPRILLQAKRLAHAICTIAVTQKELEGEPIENELKAYSSAYLDCVMLAVERRGDFLPPGVTAQLNKSREDMLRGARSDVAKHLDPDAIGFGSQWLFEFDGLLAAQKLGKAQHFLDNAKRANATQNLHELGCAILMMEKWLEQANKRARRGKAVVEARRIMGLGSANGGQETREIDQRKVNATKEYVEAVKNNDAGAVRKALIAGADPNTCDEKGVPMLVLATWEQRHEVMEAILANPLTDVDKPGPNTGPAIACAVSRLDEKAVGIVLKHRPKLTAEIGGKLMSMLDLLESVSGANPSYYTIPMIREMLLAQEGVQ